MLKRTRKKNSLVRMKDLDGKNLDGKFFEGIRERIKNKKDVILFISHEV